MSSIKRKAPAASLQRRVRARREPSEEVEDASSGSSESEDNAQEEGSDSSSSSEDEEEDDDGSSSEASAPDLAASISFGALAKAQASLIKPKKSKKSTPTEPGDGWEDNEALERKAGRKDRRDFNRSSKHAPTETSSKKAVSRKRAVVPLPKREVRDPRFEPSSVPLNEAKARRNYAFLDAYKADEMAELRERIRKSKDEGEKARMKRELLVMESKMKAQKRKDKEAEVLDRHRKEEKELVKQGKQPFYLKKAEQKKQVLLERYGDLKGKQLDRVIERRRKKVEGKEKKKMPFARRDVGA